MDRPFDFDALARELARGLSRREALRRLAGGFAGAVLAVLALPRAAAAGPGGNSACAHWCDNLPPGPDADHCASDAAHGQGLCYTCGSAAPAGHPDLCSIAGIGATCCPATAPNCCGGSCTNVLGDSSNCGQCGLACDTGASCLNGQCTADCAVCATLCPPPRFRCGPLCCPVGGDCEVDQGPRGLIYTCSCPADQCGNVCVDTQTDPANCGACGVTCSARESCVSGRCTCTSSAATCPGGESCCSGVCTNVQSDLANCGACGHGCGRGQGCCHGVCTDLTSNPNDCGACGNVCASGQGCCNGACVDLTSDHSNCGTCGHQCGFAPCCNGACCPTGTFCCNNFCCPTGMGCCSGQCVNTVNDPNNCGGCGVTCPSNCTCFFSQCVC